MILQHLNNPSTYYLLEDWSSVHLYMCVYHNLQLSHLAHKTVYESTNLACNSCGLSTPVFPRSYLCHTWFVSPCAASTWLGLCAPMSIQILYVMWCYESGLNPICLKHCTFNTPRAHERRTPCNRTQVKGFFFNWGKVNGKRGEGKQAFGGRSSRRQERREKDWQKDRETDGWTQWEKMRDGSWALPVSKGK